MSDEVADTTHRFDVAVTFAGEDRAIVAKVVESLKEAGVENVFYDEDFKAETWGANLVEFFHRVYKQEARYALMFVSQHYVRKHWTQLERRAAQDRALTEAAAYILPVRLDDSDVPGLPATTGYLDARIEGVSGIVGALRQKLKAAGPTKPKVYVGDVPKTPEQFTALLDLRPPGWEYLYFAGLLADGLQKCEPLYRDYLIEYGEPTGATKRGDDATNYLRDQLAQLAHVSEGLETVLSREAQTAAFGVPGEPGDPDRIQHLANRFVDLYRRLLTIASELRGNAYAAEGFRDAARIAARSVSGAVEATRKSVDDLCSNLLNLPERLEAGENISVAINVVWEVPEDAFNGYAEALQRGIEGY